MNEFGVDPIHGAVCWNSNHIKTNICHSPHRAVQPQHLCKVVLFYISLSFKDCISNKCFFLSMEEKKRPMERLYAMPTQCCS